MPGRGVAGRLQGRELRLGRPDWVAALSGAPLPSGQPPAAASPTRRRRWSRWATPTAVSRCSRWATRCGPARASSSPRLRRLGITPVLLSGDRAATVAAAAATLGIADARGEMGPEDKRAAIVALQRGGAVVAMAGDGINDAPALAQAQVSVSLKSATPLAQWTADVVVLSDELPRIADAIAHARRTFRVIRQNLGWAFVYNAIAIPGRGVRVRDPAASRRPACRVVAGRRRQRAAAGPAGRRARRRRPGRRPRRRPCPPPTPAADRAMDILLLLIPLSVVLVLLIGAAFWWSVHERPVRRPRGSGAPDPRRRRHQRRHPGLHRPGAMMLHSNTTP